MLWTIIVILVVLWLFGFLGSNVSPRLPKTGSWIHTLIVIALILVVLNLLKVI
ncbi:MAG: lmo0937 family membrane protein [Anaerolineaceae bacterium]|nr:lmo0937 family membrane protein [Anaerolineaceae bacterium]